MLSRSWSSVVNAELMDVRDPFHPWRSLVVCQEEGLKWNVPLQFPGFFPDRPRARFTDTDRSDFICVIATPFKATLFLNPSNSRDLGCGPFQ